FNLLLGAIPFFFLLISIFSFVLRTTVPDPQQAAIDYVFQIIPPSHAVEGFVRDQIGKLLEEGVSYGIAGVVLLVWVSTRLIGSLRSALRSIFDVREDRGIVAGKIFDAKMVVIAGTLFTANTAISVVLEAVQNFGLNLLGLQERGAGHTLQIMLAQALAYGFIFLMFLLIYRYLPARHIPWRIALVSATFSATVFELLKSAFALYVSTFANYQSTYGYVASTVVLVFWIYYSSAVFVLGGEVGQVYELYRIRRKQRELLD
ncbi:MAG TPA: YihY/virulence factor BrkB family protein, partial [Longimicrobiaceae bacterium]|nr:YihY/virulence factor BrkB family protein [Longimicrobiaceae bacterium]